MVNQGTALVVLCVAALAANAATNGTTTAFPEEEYGYIAINANYNSAMFYGIRGDPNATLRQQAPLVMWLQGGPGATSQFGNFLENGPEKLTTAGGASGTLTNRTHSWTHHANMLYVDNPVGTGFSYSASPEGFATSDTQIGDQLVIFLDAFLGLHPEYHEFWIFSESYGGKMCAYFGVALSNAIASAHNTTAFKNLLGLNFRGVAIGDGWVDPVGCMASYADYLTAFGQLTEDERKEVDKYATYAQTALEEGSGSAATNFWGIQQGLIGFYDQGTNWYNALYYYDYTADNQLDVFLAENFTQKHADIIPKQFPYNNQSGDVFEALGGAFMQAGIEQVQILIDRNYSVNIESGQLDLIVDTLCIQNWMRKLSWEGVATLLDPSSRTPLFVTAANANLGQVDIFKAEYQNVAFWQVMKAGHMIPLDNPPAAEEMMARIIGSKNPRSWQRSGQSTPPEVETKNGKRKIHRSRKPRG